MLYVNKVIEIFYMVDDFCNFFNETIKNIQLRNTWEQAKSSL